nr:hypothetical protein [Metabacillus lacus]
MANSVAVQNPQVKSVTINPALLPPDIVVDDVDSSMITNYFSQYDILDSSLSAGKMDNRVPGNQIEMYHRNPS